MDVDVVVMQDFLGALAHLRAQVAVVGGVRLPDETVGELMVDDGLRAAVEVREEDLGGRHTERDGPILGVNELDDAYSRGSAGTRGWDLGAE